MLLNIAPEYPIILSPCRRIYLGKDGWNLISKEAEDGRAAHFDFIPAAGTFGTLGDISRKVKAQ